MEGVNGNEIAIRFRRRPDRFIAAINWDLSGHLFWLQLSLRRLRRSGMLPIAAVTEPAPDQNAETICTNTPNVTAVDDERDSATADH